MKFGINQLRAKVPAIVKRIAVVCAALSTGIASYGFFVENSPIMMKIGGAALIISVVLPPLFGVQEEKKDEE